MVDPMTMLWQTPLTTQTHFLQEDIFHVVQVPNDVQMVGPLTMALCPPLMVDPSPYDALDACMTLDRDPHHGSYPDAYNYHNLPTTKNYVQYLSRHGCFSHRH